MIETLRAVENLDEILAVEGVDVFFVGPGDLSQSMGFPPAVPIGQSRDRQVLDLVDRTLERIREAGRTPGTLVVEDDIQHYASIGAQFLYIHSDPFLRSGIRRMKELARAGAGPGSRRRFDGRLAPAFGQAARVIRIGSYAEVAEMLGVGHLWPEEGPDGFAAMVGEWFDWTN